MMPRLFNLAVNIIQSEYWVSSKLMTSYAAHELVSRIVTAPLSMKSALVASKISARRGCPLVLHRRGLFMLIGFQVVSVLADYVARKVACLGHELPHKAVRRSS